MRSTHTTINKYLSARDKSSLTKTSRASKMVSSMLYPGSNTYGSERGGVIADWYCYNCNQLAYQKTNAKDLPNSGKDVCDKCKNISRAKSAIFADIEKFFVEKRQNYVSQGSEVDQSKLDYFALKSTHVGGLYGLVDDILWYLTSRTSAPGQDISKVRSRVERFFKKNGYPKTLAQLQEQYENLAG